ncbi:MAG TPA: ATP-binding protein [Streptosporangiaceae bacterium]|nr:ATP-binding protein [Streptosporangiaceae bacterium]
MNDWPLRSYLELAPLPTAIPCFRLHAVAVLHEWNLARDLIADAETLVSELMTNAHATSRRIDGHPPIALRLLAGQERLVIEAWDQSPHDLEPFTADDDAENGRGLMIVEALSTRWGSRRTGHHHKCVWAELALADASH